MAKKILVFTHISFLDTSIEHIKIVSENGYDVHVLIGLAPNQLKANIVDLEIDLRNYPPVVDFNDIYQEWGLDYLKPFFNNCASVNFVVYPIGKIGLLKGSRKVSKFIKTVDPDWIHLDEFQARQIPQLPFLIRNRKKLIMNLHDPQMHSGEFDFLRFLTRKILFKVISKFVVFSEVSVKILKNILPTGKHIYNLKLMPATVYSNFRINQEVAPEERKISFFGRVSKYKGINLFIEAINIVNDEFPNQQFIIGGKPFRGFKPEYELLNNQANVKVIERHLTNEEITEIVDNSQLIVCPYIDATQSGVVLIAHGLGCPVLVTPVGGLPDYVDHGKNGFITEEISVESLAKSMISFLKENKFEQIQASIKTEEVRADRARQYVQTIEEIYH